VRKFILIAILILLIGIITLAQESSNEVSKGVVVQGLLNPIGMVQLPNGGILIAEEGTGKDDNSAGVSLLLPDGNIGRLVSGLPSNRDSGDLSGVPLVGISPDKSTIYIGSFNAGHLWTLSVELAQSLPDKAFTPDNLGEAMQPLNASQIMNPFDIAFDNNGIPVISDSTSNAIATENADGTVRFIHRFQRLPNPDNEQTTIDPVPTGIARVDDEYYVTLFGGCPFPERGGELVAIDGNGNQRTVLDGLNLPIDVALADDGTIWVLEFATFTPEGYAACFTGAGYRSNTGRLSRLHPDGTLETVLDNLDFPGSVLPLPDGSLYIAEIFDGRILHVRFDGNESENIAEISIPNPDIPESQYLVLDDPDIALREVIESNNLDAYFGESLREGDTELARLGQDLFFDPIMSGDQNISCATCHHPALSLGDARVLPIGTGGQGLGEDRFYLSHVNLSDDYRGRREAGEIVNPFIGMLVPRNSPTVINSALLHVQFWDGRVESYGLGQIVHTQEDTVDILGLTDALAVQALFPVISELEMAGATFGSEPPLYIRRSIVQRLLAIPNYTTRFQTIFDTETIEPIHIVAAIAAFERQFIFTHSAWDNYIAGDANALTDEQKRGAMLFFGVLNPSVNCSTCHSGDLFTDLNYYNLLVPQIGRGKGNGEDGRDDWGRANVTFDYRDQFKFRTPSLRNVSLTAPYFHSGAYATLEDVIWHHANIWQSAANYDPAAYLPPPYFSSVLPFNRERQGHSAASYLANGLPLSEKDVSDLVAFLQSLTDPAAQDLSAFIPETVPSGLALDSLPAELPQRIRSESETLANVDNSEDPQTDWHFTDVAADLGIHFQHGAFATAIFDDPVAMMGAGLCWIDYDKDGWLDLYLVNSYAEDEFDYWQNNGGLPGNALYHNEQGIFHGLSEASGTNLAMRGNACIVADFDNDKWPDIFVTADGANALLWNNGDGTFTEGAELAGIADTEWNTAAAAADLNGDGWLDLFVGSYIDIENKVPHPIGAFPQDFYGIPDHLYLSNGADATGQVSFREITRDVGLVIDERTLGTIFSDLDDDGNLDLYLANDGQPNRLYQYQALADDPLNIGFRYVDTYDTSGVNDRGSGMGVASGDWSGDGWPDLMVTNWDVELNAIYRNQTPDIGTMSFAYSTYRIGLMGLGNNMTGWGVHFADFDQDTDLDVMTVNGRVPITNPEMDAELVRLYGNRLAEGYAGQFREWTQRVGLRDIGSLMARGSAVADFDNDGDLDIAINTISGKAVLLENRVVQGNWLTVDLGGIYPGTVVEITLANGQILRREVLVGSSYLASEDPRLHFGLGDSSLVDEIVIIWADRQRQIQNQVPANLVWDVTRGQFRQ
jgi:cytochrome c peroxidase